jgi:hypothetical protein
MGGSYVAKGLPSSGGTMAYNANNQLTAWGTANLHHDANSNMTSDGIFWFLHSMAREISHGVVKFSGGPPVHVEKELPVLPLLDYSFHFLLPLRGY